MTYMIFRTFIRRIYSFLFVRSPRRIGKNWQIQESIKPAQDPGYSVFFFTGGDSREQNNAMNGIGMA